MSVETSNKRILTTKQAAAYLGIVSHRSLEKWRRESIPKGPKWVNFEGNIGYRISDLDDYIKMRLRQPGDSYAA